MRRHLVRCQKQPQIVQNLFHEKHLPYTARRHYALISGRANNSMTRQQYSLRDASTVSQVRRSGGEMADAQPHRANSRSVIRSTVDFASKRSSVVSMMIVVLRPG